MKHTILDNLKDNPTFDQEKRTKHPLTHPSPK